MASMAIGMIETRGYVAALTAVHVIPRPHADLGKHFEAAAAK
jgi:ethanolamine utilization protein EutM